MDYYELSFTILPNTEVNRDVLAATLAEIGFESFSDTETGINAYIPDKLYRKEQLDEAIGCFPLEGVQFGYEALLVETQDWNVEWEKNFFQPIVIDNQCVVHSSFHTDIPNLPFNIIIDPKMAFGTGHHETTSLMISFLLQIDVKNKSFLDMGCGTAILAILAKMKEANPVLAIDNDEWACNNSIENIKLNRTPDISVECGDSENIRNQQFDIIFANINRNILLNDIPSYSSCLNKGGELYMSGFYEEDLPMITNTCKKNELQYKNHKKKNHWVAVQFVKS